MNPNSETPTEQTETPKPTEVMEEKIESKHAQAKNQRRLAIVFIFIALVGVASLGLLLFGSITEDESLSTDEQLKADANRLGLAVINWNNGNQPFELTPENSRALSISYLDPEFNDPRTNRPYTLTTIIPAEGELQYVIGGICNTDDSVSQSGDRTNFAIRVLQEDTSKLYCIEKSEVRQPATN